MAILDLQKRIRQIGTLRLGEQAETRDGKKYPRSRETWRITCTTEEIAKAISLNFGGSVKTWEHEREPFLVDTETDRLPIAVVPGHAYSGWYELWSGGGCQRRCDGYEEQLTGEECLCDPEARTCKPMTRLSVVLRGIDALGLFRLNTGGWYAATELAGAIEFLESATAAGQVLPGTLRIEERRQIRDGQTKRFKVPVLDVPFGIDRILTGQSSLGAPAGAPQEELVWTPVAAIEQGEGIDVERGQELAAAGAEPRPRTSRSAEPIGEAPDFVNPDEIPIDDGPPQEEALFDEDGSTEDAVAPEQKLLTKPQAKKLDTLVGKLREPGHLTTGQLYAKIAKLRSIPVDQMIELIEGARDEEGDLHWAPLREGLFRPEATALIESLETYEAQIAARADAFDAA